MPRAAILAAWPKSEAARMSRMVLTGPVGTSQRPWATRGRPGPTSNRAAGPGTPPNWSRKPYPAGTHPAHAMRTDMIGRLSKSGGSSRGVPG
jgi:hypothetical protein